MVNKSQKILSICIQVFGWLFLAIFLLFIVTTYLASGWRSLGVLEVFIDVILIIPSALIIGFGYFIKRESRAAKLVSIIIMWSGCIISALMFIASFILLLGPKDYEDAGAAIAMGFGLFVISIIALAPNSFLLWLFYKEEKGHKIFKDFLIGIGSLAILVVLIVAIILGVKVVADMDQSTSGPLDKIIEQEQAYLMDAELFDDEFDTGEEATILRRNAWDVGESFVMLPAKYRDGGLDSYEVYDEDNDYIKALYSPSSDDAAPSDHYLEYTVFRSTTDMSDFYGVVEVVQTPLTSHYNAYFLQFEDRELKDRSADIFAKVDQDVIHENGLASLMDKAPDLADEGYEDIYYVKLPREGTTIEFILYVTGDVIYEIRWNGEEFVVVD